MVNSSVETPMDTALLRAFGNRFLTGKQITDRLWFWGLGVRRELLSTAWPALACPKFE
jgi:hypothetical protein